MAPANVNRGWVGELRRLGAAGVHFCIIERRRHERVHLRTDVVHNCIHGRTEPERGAEMHRRSYPAAVPDLYLAPAAAPDLYLAAGRTHQHATRAAAGSTIQT